jgi:glutamate-1-semialdehyde 2,1-aminomutase
MAERVTNSGPFERALRSIAGGVNSPVRAFGAVGAPPLFAARGHGPWLYDAEGNRYVDHLMSWGAVILGHAHPAVQVAIEKASRRGTGFGLSTSVEAELAELIKDAFPSVELLRLVNSGTEAVMSAVRLARGHTGRTKVLKFEGCYHGHSDGLLVRAGSGLATFGLPASAGVPRSFAGETLLARYNDLGSVESVCEVHGEELACILVEPVAGNMGVVPPEPGFLEGLRKLCDRSGALLIFDEVITGFRIAWGGAQERYGVRADLTTLGKIIGGGLPVGAFGGRGDIMEHLAPLGDVYQAGTLSGNPVVAAAGKAALETLRELNPYAELDSAAGALAAAVSEAAQAAGVPVWVGRVGPMLTVFFTEGAVKDYDSARRADDAQYARFFRALLGRTPDSEFNGGVLFPPSQWESAFVGTCHLQDDLLQATAAGCAEALHAAQLQPTAPVR